MRPSSSVAFVCSPSSSLCLISAIKVEDAKKKHKVKKKDGSIELIETYLLSELPVDMACDTALSSFHCSTVVVAGLNVVSKCSLIACTVCITVKWADSWVHHFPAGTEPLSDTSYNIQWYYTNAVYFLFSKRLQDEQHSTGW